MAQLIAEIQLRNPHRVLLDGNAYVVESCDPHGTTYARRVPLSVVATVQTMLSGEDISATEAAVVVEPVAATLGLPFHYGYKLTYYVQDVLLVLVARGDATLRKEGRAYFYAIEP